MAIFGDIIYEIKEKELILDYQRYEYTNNMLYDFFIRTLKNEKTIEDFVYKPIMEHTLKIKDVILFENNEIKFTLQDVIYNACPKLYEVLIQDDKIKDKISYSMNISEFLFSINEAEDNTKKMEKKMEKKEGEKLTPEEEKSFNESKNFFNTVIYKDLNQNKYIQLTKDEVLKKIDETLLYKKINVRHKKQQLNIEECNFINIYDLNINLPDEELLDYLLMLKANHKKKSINKEFDELSDEEKSKIKRYITFKNKKLLTKKNSKRKLEFTREPVLLINDFLKVNKEKRKAESKINKEVLEKKYYEYKNLEQENLERIKKELKKLEYKSYIYDSQKLAHILFVYDHMQTKIENNTYDQLMKRIQCSILYHRREFINIIDMDDLEDECGLSKNNSKIVYDLIGKLYILLKFNPSLGDEYDKSTLIKIEEEDIKEIDKLMKKIYSIIDIDCRRRFLPYLPYISIRTLYKYYEIAKFYIDDKGYKLLLD